MIDPIVYGVQHAYALAYNFVVQTIPYLAVSIMREGQGFADLIAVVQAYGFVVLPAIAILVYVLKNRREFARQHGSSAARGCAFTVLAYAAGWTALILFVVEEEASKGAWTSAILAPAMLWPIGFLAIAATVYGTLGFHWLVVRLLPRT